MVEVVIIGHNEGESVTDMVRSIPSEWHKIYVADRCTDKTLKRLSFAENTAIVDTTPLGLVGRQTSFCRNLGLSECAKDSDVLFLDGDRYVVYGDIKKAVENCDTDILLFRLEDDNRTDQSTKENYGRLCNGFFSCGIFFRRSAIDRVMKFQGGQLFNEGLQNDWGIEDISLGDVCYHLGLSVSLCEDVHLHGCFTRFRLDNLDVLERRLRFRNRLNVKWK